MSAVGNTIDTYYAIKLSHLLTKPFDMWDAFKLGIIDADGNVLKSPSTVEEKSAWTRFHVVSKNLKRLAMAAPGGKTALRYGAAYLLLKEFISETPSLTNQLIPLLEDMVAGDAGGDPQSIASGETSGPITSTGPKGTTKKKKSFKKFIDKDTI